MSQPPTFPHHQHRVDLDSPLHRKAGPTSHAMTPIARNQVATTKQAGTPPRYLTNAEAATYLRLSPRTLEKQRVIGGGPRFHKFGRRVMYALADLETWASERSFETTFDPEYLERHLGAQRDDQ